MSKLLVVFGATGQLGGSVISHVLKSLSGEYRIRGVTRDPTKASAQALGKLGVEVVKGDFLDVESIKEALKGADVVFAMSVMPMDENGINEFDQGKVIADSSVEQGVKLLVWQTLPYLKLISNGKYRNVRHFDEKAQAQEYIQKLPIKSAFILPGFFFENFLNIFKPKPVGDGYAVFNTMKPDVKIPCLDVANDFGQFFCAVLKSPEKYEKVPLYAASGVYSFEDFTKDIHDSTGRRVDYMYIDADKFKTFLPSSIATDITEMFEFYNDFRFGPETDHNVSVAHLSIDFKPATAKEFFKNNASKMFD